MAARYSFLGVVQLFSATSVTSVLNSPRPISATLPTVSPFLYFDTSYFFTSFT